MTSSSVRRTSFRDWWDDTPTVWKVGVIIGIAAWLISISESSVHTVNGAITECSYLDYAKVGFGALVAVLGIAGLVATRRSRRPLATPVAAVITLVLLADGGLLVLKGLDIMAGVCPV